MAISDALRKFLRSAPGGDSVPRGHGVQVDASCSRMFSCALFPKKLWRRHEVLRLLGWAEDLSRYNASFNHVMLPTEPLGAVLSGLALCPSLEEAEGRRAYVRYARHQLDILLHEYQNRHWSARQRRYREDVDWLADKLRQRAQFARMGLDRRYSGYVKQRSLSKKDPLNPVVELSCALFSDDVRRAVRQMQIMEDEFSHGPQSSYDRVVNLCAGLRGDGECPQKGDATSSVALCSEASCLSGRSWETEEQFSVVFGLEPDQYHFSTHAKLIQQIEAWLALTAAHPCEVCRAAEEERALMVKGTGSGRAAFFYH